MRVVIQRVSEASVEVQEQGYRASVGPGLLVLAAFVDEDDDPDLSWIVRKIVSLRIFDDESGVMNLSVADVGGEVMAINQFTLYAITARGKRPSYIKAAQPETAEPLF